MKTFVFTYDLSEPNVSVRAYYLDISAIACSFGYERGYERGSSAPLSAKTTK